MIPAPKFQVGDRVRLRRCSTTQEYFRTHTDDVAYVTGCGVLLPTTGQQTGPDWVWHAYLVDTWVGWEFVGIAECDLEAT